ncbi:MAG: hypothetical protein QOH24_1993 [Verrucomicrobiota bacterium]|jgi:hypothetical protein
MFWNLELLCRSLTVALPEGEEDTSAPGEGEKVINPSFAQKIVLPFDFSSNENSDRVPG